MDREVMTLYYDRVHEDVVGDAMVDSEEYRKAHREFVRQEEEFQEKYKIQPEMLNEGEFLDDEEGSFVCMANDMLKYSMEAMVNERYQQMPSSSAMRIHQFLPDAR